MHVRDRVPKVPWNQPYPTVYRGSARWSQVDVTCPLPEVAGLMELTPEEILEALDALDARGGPHCYRDGRGRKMFGTVMAWPEHEPEGGGLREVAISFVQTSYVEGTSVY